MGFSLLSSQAEIFSYNENFEQLLREKPMYCLREKTNCQLLQQERAVYILCKIYLKQLNLIWIPTPHIFPCLFCHDVIARLPFSMCCGQMRQILALFEWNSRAQDHVARKHAHDKLTRKPVCTDWNVAPYLRVFHARIHKKIPLIPIPNHPRSAHLMFVS